ELAASQVKVLKNGVLVHLEVHPRETLDKAYDNAGTAANPWQGADFGGKTPAMLLIGAGYTAPFLRPWITEHTREEVAAIAEGEIPGLETVVIDNPKNKPPTIPENRFIPVDIQSLTGESTPAALQAAADTIVDFLVQHDLVGIGSMAVINSFVLLNAYVQNALKRVTPAVQANPAEAVLAGIKKSLTRTLVAEHAPHRTVWSAKVNTEKDSREVVVEQAKAAFRRLRELRPDADAVIKFDTSAGKGGLRKDGIDSEEAVAAAVLDIYRELDDFWAKNETVRQLHTVSAHPSFILEEKISGISEYDVEMVFRTAANGVLEAFAFVIGNPNPVRVSAAEKGATFPAMLGADLRMDTILAAIESTLAVWHPVLPFGNFHIEIKISDDGRPLLIEINPTRPGGATIVPDTIAWTSRAYNEAGEVVEQAPLNLIRAGVRANLGLSLFGVDGSPVPADPAGVLVRRKLLPAENGKLVEVTLDDHVLGAGSSIELAPGVELTITKNPGENVYAAGPTPSNSTITYSDDTIGRVKVRTTGESNATQEEAIAAALAALARVKVHIKTVDGRDIVQPGDAYHFVEDEIYLPKTEPAPVERDAQQAPPSQTGPPLEGTLFNVTADGKPVYTGAPVELAPGVALSVGARQARLTMEEWSKSRGVLTVLAVAAVAAAAFAFLPAAAALGAAMASVAGLIVWATRPIPGDDAAAGPIGAITISEDGVSDEARLAARQALDKVRVRVLDQHGHMSERKGGDIPGWAAAIPAPESSQAQAAASDAEEMPVAELSAKELKEQAVAEAVQAGIFDNARQAQDSWEADIRAFGQKVDAAAAAGSGAALLRTKAVVDEARERRERGRTQVLSPFYRGQLGNKAIFSIYYPLFYAVMKLIGGTTTVGKARSGYTGALALSSPFSGVMVESLPVRRILTTAPLLRSLIWVALIPLSLFAAFSILGTAGAALATLGWILGALMFADGLVVSFTHAVDMDGMGMELLSQEYDFPIDNALRNEFQTAYESFGAKAQFLFPVLVSIALALVAGGTLLAGAGAMTAAWAAAGLMALVFGVATAWSVFNYVRIPKPEKQRAAKSLAENWAAFKEGLLIARSLPQIGMRILFDAGEKSTWNVLRLMTIPALAMSGIAKALHHPEAWGAVYTTAIIAAAMVGTMFAAGRMKKRWAAASAGKSKYEAFRDFFPMMFKATLATALIAASYPFIAAGGLPLVLGVAMALTGAFLFNWFFAGATLGARYMKNEAAEKAGVAGRVAGIDASIGMLVDGLVVFMLGLSHSFFSLGTALWIDVGYFLAVGLISRFIAPKALFTAEERGEKR
ncbi:MAG TPA: hypothetical protein VNI01_15620, partial [Elusimicrobiota bacterium]|nr:hypothetical protein [Elusimicrobiota bacterium]